MATVLVDRGADVERRILDELSRLPIPEQLTIIETALLRIREELQQAGRPSVLADRRQQLARAAEALLPDYIEDAELTAFTALDGEDFYAEG